MKIKNRHIAIAILFAGLAAGCSQQQAAPPVETVPEPIIEVPQAPEPMPVIEEPAPVVQPAPIQRPRPHVRPRPPVKVPPVKAKGNYRGAVPIDRRAVQQYQY